MKILALIISLFSFCSCARLRSDGKMIIAVTEKVGIKLLEDEAAILIQDALK